MPATANNTTPSISASVMQLHPRLVPNAGAPRDMAELVGALLAEDAQYEKATRAEEARHKRATAAIYAEISVALGEGGALVRTPAGERSDSKKQAAAALNLKPKRMMAIIGRYHADHPTHPLLAVQPGGSKHSRWIVYTDRVRAVMELGVPY